MHDGYLYTMAICGTATNTSPAPAILNTMLESIPPVKRAALLGEIVPVDRYGQPQDRLIDDVITDMRDAELFFFITPIYHTARPDVRVLLPERLSNLLRRAEPLAAEGVLREKLAVLVVVDPANDPALPEREGEPVDKVTNSVIARIVYRQTLFAALQRFCVAAGIQICGTAIVSASDSDDTPRIADEDIALVKELAQRAYQQARELKPDALPEML